MTLENTIPLDPPVEASVDANAAPVPTTPRIRWAGIVWGAVFSAAAASALWILASATRRESIHAWLLTLGPESINPGAVVGFVVLAVGLLLVILGGVALLRRAQVRATIER